MLAMNTRTLLRAGRTASRQPVIAPATMLQQQKRFASSDHLYGEEFKKAREHEREHAAKSGDMWRKLSYYAALPTCLVLGVYIYKVEAAHYEHHEHELQENDGELPERTYYDYNDMRKKPFPWAKDGHDNSFFFNPKVNRDITY